MQEAASVATPEQVNFRRMKNIGGRLVAVDIGGTPLVENAAAEPATRETAGATQESKVSAEAKPGSSEKRVEQIVDTITGRGAIGKFPSGTGMYTNDRLGRLDINYTYGNDYTIFGDRPDLQRATKGMIQHFTFECGKNGMGAPNYMMFTPLFDDGVHTETMVNHFFHSYYPDMTGRPVNYLSTTFIMPPESATELTAIVRSQPDAAEVFFKKAARGIEEWGGAETDEQLRHQGGVPRTLTDTLILLDGDKFLPVLRATSYQGDLIKQAMETGATRLQYTQPYGQVPFRVR